MYGIYKTHEHEYIISSERAYHRNDEQGCLLCSDNVYKVGDVIVREGLKWTIEEVIE